MRNLLRKEFFALQHNSFFWICFIIIILSGILTGPGYMLDLVTRKDAIAIFDSMIYDSTVWIVFFATAVTYLVGKEFTNRTINNDISTGHSRKTIFISKCIVYFVVYNILILLFPVIGSIRMSFTLGVEGTVFHNIFHILKVLAFSLILNSAVFSICLFIVFWFKDIARATSVSAILVLISALIVAYGNPLGWFHQLPLLRFMPMQQIRIILPDNISAYKLMEALISSLVIIFFFVCISLKRFKKCELK